MHRPEGLTLLLWDLQSPINIGMILRVAETFGAKVAIMGSHKVLRDEARLNTLSDFACGALTRAGYAWLETPGALGDWLDGRRLVTTTVEPDSITLPEFRFEPGDVIVLGSEYDGVPVDVERQASGRLRIPMADVQTPKPRSHAPIDPMRSAGVARDGMPNLNVAIAGGIICYTWFSSGAVSQNSQCTL